MNHRDTRDFCTLVWIFSYCRLFCFGAHVPLRNSAPLRHCAFAASVRGARARALGSVIHPPPSEQQGKGTAGYQCCWSATNKKKKEGEIHSVLL